MARQLPIVTDHLTCLYHSPRTKVQRRWSREAAEWAATTYIHTILDLVDNKIYKFQLKLLPNNIIQYFYYTIFLSYSIDELVGPPYITILAPPLAARGLALLGLPEVEATLNVIDGVVRTCPCCRRDSPMPGLLAWPQFTRVLGVGGVELLRRRVMGHRST